MPSSNTALTSSPRREILRDPLIQIAANRTQRNATSSASPNLSASRRPRTLRPRQDDQLFPHLMQRETIIENGGFQELPRLEDPIAVKGGSAALRTIGPTGPRPDTTARKTSRAGDPGLARPSCRDLPAAAPRRSWSHFTRRSGAEDDSPPSVSPRTGHTPGSWALQPMEIPVSYPSKPELARSQTQRGEGSSPTRLVSYPLSREGLQVRQWRVFWLPGLHLDSISGRATVADSAGLTPASPF